MESGYWGNYKKGVFFEIDEHELWIRRGNNAIQLGIPNKIVGRFCAFEVGKDREQFLPFLFASAPVMRWRGHGQSVTFEFNANTWIKPLSLIKKWCTLNAGAFLHLNMINFKNMEIRQTLWKNFCVISD